MNRNQDVLSRESRVAAREDAVELRERAVHVRDEAVTAREREMRADQTARATADGHITLLQQVNERLVIATIEAQELAEQLQIAKSEMETAKFAAEKANLAKSEFLSNMSHELRTPLNAILGFAQMMASASPPPTAYEAANIAQILEAGWHLLALVTEILDLTAIESGKLALALAPVSLAGVLSECQNMMEPEAQKRGIRMTFPRLASPMFVWADRTRLKQILVNLLANATKYNRDQGSVVIDVTAITAKRTRISVTDTGDGLSPEKLAQLFQPFNRLGQEAGSVPGTGIGLVVARQLAGRMGGSVGVASTVGEGTVFWVELLAAAAPEPTVAASEPAGQAHPVPPRVRTLLYVEDNPANLELVAQIIARRPDLRLLTAINGALGIEIARGSQPEVILMDLKLPGLSGTEAMKILRDDPVTSHIPVVAVSAYARPEDIANGLEAGFASYLTKPISVKEFMATLDLALEFSAEKHLSEG